MRGLIFFLFIFFNFLNPISPILTILVDLLVLVSSRKIRFGHDSLFSIIVIGGIIIWIWSIFVMAINLHFDTYIFVKYLRMPIMAVILSGCVSNLKFKKETVINSFYYLCLCNLLMIGIELAVPGTREILAKIMNVARTDVASGIALGNRVMGLAGSYEFCAIMCIMLIVICYFKYKQKNSLIHLITIIISFASLIAVSRTGMLVGAAVLAFVMIGLFKAAKSYHRVIIGGFSFAGVFLAGYIIIPIVLNSSGLLDNAIETKYALEIVTSDYGSGTASELTSGGSHLNILKEPFTELVFGYGINSEDITTKKISTDIGYLEYICHIGIVGLCMVILMHLLLVKRLNEYRKSLHKLPASEDIQQLISVTIIYIAILFIFNYKLMLLYSRGTFELMTILVFAAVKLTKKHKELCVQNTI